MAYRRSKGTAAMTKAFKDKNRSRDKANAKAMTGLIGLVGAACTAFAALCVMLLKWTVQAMLWLGKQIAAVAVFVWVKISAAWRSRQQ